MSTDTAKIRVLNSLLFVRDPKTNDLPEIDGLRSVWSTPSCVAMSCRPDSEGVTTVTLNSRLALTDNDKLLFDGWIQTPSRTVIVEDVLAKPILSTRVSSAMTRLRAWTNGHPATDKVVVVLD